MDRYSFLGAAHTQFIDHLYEQYLESPDSVEPSWRAFFQGYDFAQESYNGSAGDYAADQVTSGVAAQHVEREFRVLKLIEGYRTRGHLFTKTNPVRERRKYVPTLELKNFDLSDSDLDSVFQAGSEIGLGATTLKDIVNHLEQVYCQSIGVEYMYIRDPEERRWIQNWLQKDYNTPKFSKKQKMEILTKLTEAVAFEGFLHRKFVGQKRFSLEGAEALIPALDAAIERGAHLGVEEFVVGMAHRGRLNVLANVFGKTYTQIFSEFESKDFEDELFDGDVKYHLGYTSNHQTEMGKEVLLNLSPNPSHLEAVDPVVEGMARAKINNDWNEDTQKVAPILIHGDAAIAGQGVVYEVIQMAKLDGYKTGGSVHIVANNQVGFTTNYIDGRSSTYCTDVAKVTLSPVLHVNGDDVEAVVHAMIFAMDYRQQFHKDVFIDLLGYRKYGHNEGDEPRFTQPNLYKIIAKHPNPRKIYTDKLIAEGTLDQATLKQIDEEFKKQLEGDFDESKKIEKNKITPFMEQVWEPYTFANNVEQMFADVDTTYDLDKLRELGRAISQVPEGKNLYKKMVKVLGDRRKMIEETNNLDWGMAELLAYSTLLTEGHNVRISGQDVERGTFSHRHAIMKVEESEEEVCLLNELGVDQGRFAIYNSLLSEYAVMGFDYGYSLAAPETLVIWEAQFGDFSNGAQIMIDQFISAAEDKWKNRSGMVLFLPHGYEGQGAEHSSARLERYLQLCADLNMIVAYPTTPANHFHLLRRQMRRNFRKPLVVMTPKSLLRHPRATSHLEELSEGHFRSVIDDATADPSKVRKVVFCTGKVYYELLAEKEERKADDVALVRIEQLYPLPKDEIKALLIKYQKADKHIWTQEEPANMGAWGFLLQHFPEEVRLQRVSLKASAAPATGSSKRAMERQRAIVQETFEI
ncbi:2-oxoglutarate dehydrogenase E1 component [Cryomorphaceae bacterium]|nr:2-oxoglutarate dehydrogenase E1 component [Cryomorphaceae bacterium]